MHKSYLLDVQKKGKKVLPLAIYKKGSNPEQNWFSQFNSPEVLVKPAISGGSKNTIRFSVASWEKQKDIFDLILKEQDLIVQPFATEVQTEGEYSFFFFDNQFSHAIVKKPQKGDFRAHSFFGAQLQPYQPTADEVTEVSEFLSCPPTPCPYARIDLVRFKGALNVIELEIIEPYLYLEFSDPKIACKNFAKAIINSIK